LQQKLSPQQIQYIKLLQLPTLALEQRIKAEMEINPLLEEGDDEEELELTDEQQEITDELEAGTDASETDAREEEGDSDEEVDWDVLLNNSDDLDGSKARVDRSSEEDDREMPMPARETMTDDPRSQLAYLDLTEDDEVIAEQIIGSIDEDG